MLFNPATDRQRRTRDLMFSAGMAGAASAVGRLQGGRRATGAPVSSLVQKAVRAAHEPKNVDNQFTGTLNGATTPSTIQLLNGIAQGTGGSQRTGRQVRLESLEFMLQFTSDSTSLGNESVRVLVVLDKECRGSAPAGTDVIQFGATTADVSLVSPYNFDNVPSRFTVLYDQTFESVPFCSPTTTTVVPRKYTVCQRQRMNQKVHYYNTSGSAIADIDSGSIYLLIWSDNSTKPSTYSCISRVVYRDL